MEKDPLLRIAAALERLSPSSDGLSDITDADAYVWQAGVTTLRPVTKVNRVPLGLLKGIDSVRDILLENTRRFAQGLPANNALLWGARGMGKSSLIKAVHGAVMQALPGRLALTEIHREDIATLPDLLRTLAADQAENL